MKPIVQSAVRLFALANYLAFVVLLPCAVIAGVVAVLGTQPQMALAVAGTVVIGFHLWRKR